MDDKGEKGGDLEKKSGKKIRQFKVETCCRAQLSKRKQKKRKKQNIFD